MVRALFAGLCLLKGQTAFRLIFQLQSRACFQKVAKMVVQSRTKKAGRILPAVAVCISKKSLLVSLWYITKAKHPNSVTLSRAVSQGGGSWHEMKVLTATHAKGDQTLLFLAFVLGSIHECTCGNSSA